MRPFLCVSCLALIAVGAAACEQYDHVYVNEGRVCVEPAAVEAFGEGDVLTLTVRADECISACAQDADATCTAVRHGDQIEVVSEGHWNEPGGGACIALCAALDAECIVEDVPPGDYEIVHGGEGFALSLPSELEAGCLAGE